MARRKTSGPDVENELMAYSDAHINVTEQQDDALDKEEFLNLNLMERATSQLPRRVLSPESRKEVKAAEQAFQNPYIEDKLRRDAEAMARRSARAAGLVSSRESQPSTVARLSEHLGVDPALITPKSGSMIPVPHKQWGWSGEIPRPPGILPRSVTFNKNKMIMQGATQEELGKQDAAEAAYTNYSLSRLAAQLRGEYYEGDPSTYHVSMGDTVHVYRPKEGGFEKVTEYSPVAPPSPTLGIHTMWSDPSLIARGVKNDKGATRLFPTDKYASSDYPYFNPQGGLSAKEVKGTERLRRAQAEANASKLEVFHSMGGLSTTPDYSETSKVNQNNPIVFKNPEEEKEWIRSLGKTAFIAQSPDAIIRSNPTAASKIRELGQRAASSVQFGEFRRMLQPGYLSTLSSPAGLYTDPVTGFSTFLGKKGIRGRGVSPAGHTRDFLQSPYRDPLTDTVDEWDAAAHNAKLAGVPHHTFVSQWMDFQHNKYGGLTGIAPSANPLETYKEPPSAEYTEALQNAATHGVSPLEFHTHVQRHKMGIPSITDQSGAVVDPVEHFRNLGKAFSGVSGTASILGTSGQRDIIKRTEDIPYATRVVPTPETTEKLPRGIAGGATFYQSFTPTRTDIPESPELDRSAVGANPDRIIDPSLRYPTKEAAQAAARVMDMLSKMRPIDRLQEARAVGRGLAERLPKTSTSLSDIARQVKSINTRNKSAALDINPRATPEYSEAYREYQEAVNPIVKQFRASEINEMTRPYVTPAGLSGSQQLMSALSRSLESMPGGRRARVQAIEELRPQSIETGQRNRTQ